MDLNSHFGFIFVTGICKRDIHQGDYKLRSYCDDHHTNLIKNYYIQAWFKIH